VYAAHTIDERGNSTHAGESGSVPWWSFSKLVLATSALFLVEQRKLGLDDQVEGEEYTLRQLLQHEAGLPDHGWLDDYHAAVERGDEPWSSAETVSRTLRAFKPRPPGSDWAYSNIGYYHLAKIICSVTGKTLPDALISLSLAPAGLQQARLASTREDLAAVQMGSVLDYHPGWVLHGLIVGPLVEAAQFLHGLLQGRLLGRTMLDEMMKVRLLPEHGDEVGPDPAYGLGLMGASNGPGTPCGHSGEGPGSAIAVYGRGLGADAKVAAVWRSAAASSDVEADTLDRLAKLA